MGEYRHPNLSFTKSMIFMRFNKMIFNFNIKCISYSLDVFENISYFDRFHTKEIIYGW